MQLFDIDENTVFVNSFIECEHYVTGGWVYDPIQNLETSMHFLIIGGIFLSVIIKFILFQNQSFTIWKLMKTFFKKKNYMKIFFFC